MASKVHVLHKTCLPGLGYTFLVSLWLLIIWTIEWESGFEAKFPRLDKLPVRNILSTNVIREFETTGKDLPIAKTTNNENVATVTNSRRCLQSYFEIWNKCCFNYLLIQHLESIGFTHTISQSRARAKNLVVTK